MDELASLLIMGVFVVQIALYLAVLAFILSLLLRLHKALGIYIREHEREEDDEDEK